MLSKKVRMSDWSLKVYNGEMMQYLMDDAYAHYCVAIDNLTTEPSRIPVVVEKIVPAADYLEEEQPHDRSFRPNPFFAQRMLERDVEKSK